MIKEILGGFRCDEALKAEAEKLAKSTFTTERAMAVGLVGAYWRPTWIEDAVRAMLGTNPVEEARTWIRSSMSEEDLVSVETERKALTSGLTEDLVHLLSADEEEWNETERVHVRETERKISALGFILDAAAFRATVRLAETG